MSMDEIAAKMQELKDMEIDPEINPDGYDELKELLAALNEEY